MHQLEYKIYQDKIFQVHCICTITSFISILLCLDLDSLAILSKTHRLFKSQMCSFRVSKIGFSHNMQAEFGFTNLQTMIFFSLLNFLKKKSIDCDKPIRFSPDISTGSIFRGNAFQMFRHIFKYQTGGDDYKMHCIQDRFQSFPLKNFKQPHGKFFTNSDQIKKSMIYGNFSVI